MGVFWGPESIFVVLGGVFGCWGCSVVLEGSRVCVCGPGGSLGEFWGPWRSFGRVWGGPRGVEQSPGVFHGPGAVLGVLEVFLGSLGCLVVLVVTWEVLEVFWGCQG